MPRSVYRQSAGNPIQHHLVPSEPLELEFAYYRGVDNDDDLFTGKVLKELAFVSTTGLICCWVQSFVFDLTFVVMLGVGIVAVWGSRAVKSHVVAMRNVSVTVIAAAWCYHLFPLPVVIEVYVALTATALLAREIVRHFTFVATVSPATVETAWDIRETISWQTLISSLPLIPIALSILIPQYTRVLLLVTGVGWCVMISVFAESPEKYVNGFREAVKSWCSYHRDDQPLAGILVSPSGNCRTRLTMLVVVILLNVFAFFRVTSLLQVSEVSISFTRLLSSANLLELVFSLAAFILLCAGLALLPVLLMFLAILVVGTPVFGRLSIPKPSFVPASEWKEITNRIRSSQNKIEQDSLYLGRVTYDQSPMIVPSEVFREHAHFLGDSGSGKTARGLSPFIEQVLGSGKASVMVLDLKGDSPELLQTLKQGAKTAKEMTGTNVPIRYFTQRDDLATYGFNPFKLSCWGCLNELQKTDILCGALGLNYGSDYGEGYFSSANASVLYATVTHFPEIKSFEQLRDKLAYVISAPKRHGLDDKSKDAGNHVKMTVTRLASIAALNITEECSPSQEVADYCIDPARLFEHPEAHYFSLSATLGPGSSPEIGRLASYMLLTAATLTERKVPVYLVVDEFQRMASRNLDYLLQLARSMGVAVILANQSMQDLLRYDLTSTLETNCRYRQWFAISGWDDQERLSKASGETIDTMDSVSVSQSVGGNGTTTNTSHSRNDFIARRVDDSLFKGQLGWTDPSPGFSIKKGGTSLQVSVTFDSGVQLKVDVYWIDFVTEESAELVASKMIEHFRGTPFDANASMATRWERDYPFYEPSETKIVGRGLDGVYAYTYLSCVQEVTLAGEPHYPMKIGYTSGVGGALQRIHGQFPHALADDARVQFIGRCSDGRRTEGKIHKHIRDAGRKLTSAPGREWFTTTASEVEELFLKHRS